MNIKNILVPVDFSPTSRLAVDYGVAFARKFHARLTLLHVAEHLPPFAGSFRIETEALQREHEAQALRMLSSLLSPEDQDDLDLRIVIKTGNIKEQICAAVEEESADIVLMGTHGRGLLARWFIGSITEGIVRKLAIPVLTVCHAGAPLAFKRILFATDLSEESKEGLHVTVELAQALRSELVILHVIDKLNIPYGVAEMAPYAGAQDLEDAKARLAMFAGEAARAKVKTETILVEGNAADAILKAAEEQLPDLIFITIHKKGVVERALLGTTAERVVREAKVPVLSVPTGTSLLRENLAGAQSEVKHYWEFI